MLRGAGGEEEKGIGLGWDGAQEGGGEVVERRRRKKRESDEVACRKSRSKQCMWSVLSVYFGSQAEHECVLSRMKAGQNRVCRG